MTWRSLFLVRLFIRSVAHVPERRKTGDRKSAMPDLSRNKDTCCGKSFSIARQSALLAAICWRRRHLSCTDDISSPPAEETSRRYLHYLEEALDGFGVVRELLQQMFLHLRFPWEDGVLAHLLAQADPNGVKVLTQLLELKLALRDLVEGDSQQTVLVKLTDVVKAWRGKSRKSFRTPWF